MGANGLGNNKDEILISYNHFINTSCKPVQRIILAELEKMIFFKTKVKVKLVLEQNPILDIDDLGSEIGTNPKGGETVVGPETELSINDNLKKLSGREYQNLMRIIREYSKNKITRDMAKQMLKSGYGLTEEECSAYLGEEEQETI